MYRIKLVEDFTPQESLSIKRKTEVCRHELREYMNSVSL